MFICPYIEVRETEEYGKGVFATAEIEPGAPIGDYLGIITKPDEGPEHDDGSVYDMWYSDEADICPQHEDDGVHLLNTSCEPNCAMTPVGRHTLLFALRKIFPCEELTYDYFMGDQDEDCEAGTDNCMCGSEFCRGTMYSNPKAYEEWDEYLENLIGDAPEAPPVPYGEMLPPLDEYPESIDDNPIYSLWGTHVREPLECDTEIFGDLAAIRKTIRESGRRLKLPELNVIIEGVMYGGHVALSHMIKSARDSDSTSNLAKDQELAVPSSA